MRFILRGGGLGDTVALLPILEAWRKENPEAAFHPNDGWQSEVFAGPFAAAGERPDPLVWTFNCSALPAFPGNLPQLYASQCGVKIDDQTPCMYLSEDEMEAGRLTLVPLWTDVAFDRGIIAMDPWAGWPTRRWPWSRFAALVKELANNGFGVIEVGAKAATTDEKDRPEALPAHASFYNIQSIRQVAATLMHCDLFIGNDSGLAHVAAAVGIPQVIIYGVVPWYQRAYWNTTPVVSTVRCNPGCAAECTKLGPVSLPCMEVITVDEVHWKVQLALERFVEKGR